MISFQGDKEVAAAAESNVDFTNDAAICHVREVVMATVRQVKRHVDQLEQKEATGKVEYCSTVLLLLFSSSHLVTTESK